MQLHKVPEIPDPGIPRVLQPGYRLLASVLVAFLAFLLSSAHPETVLRIVLAWDCGVLFLLLLIASMISRTGPDQTLVRARKEETSNIVILLVTMLAVAGALTAIGYGLPKTKNLSLIKSVFDIAVSVAGVFLAWLLLHVMYSLQYAKVYYGRVAGGDANACHRGLVFPGNDDIVDYWGFLYYSFTIAMCFQTSDITVTSPYMRRLTLFHAIVSYIFALAILGLLLDGFMANI
jgi:uncharacterized membrane protein